MPNVAGETISSIAWAIADAVYRAAGIRTRDLLHPRQALYQAEPQPVLTCYAREPAYFAYFGETSKRFAISPSRSMAKFGSSFLSGEHAVEP
ncbi:MAG: hypothetical protein QOI34_733 [Verrucomicrobiota bacterium]